MKKSTNKKINKLEVNKEKKKTKDLKMAKKIKKNIGANKVNNLKKKIQEKAASRKHVKVKIKSKVQDKIKKEIPKSKVPSGKLVKTSASNKLPLASLAEAVLGPVDMQSYLVKKDEEYMGAKQLKHFRGILLLWKEKLIKDIASTARHLQEEAPNYPDPIDRASQEEGFSLEVRTRDRERRLLKKIENTLVCINSNDYGYCHDCGAEIGVHRLEVRPTATQCIDCKTISEIKEKQLGE